MLYPNAQDWKDWLITDEVHQFFCLHWTELFDPETPDTWQVRSSNVKTILRELIDASRIAAGGFEAYRGVMRSILDEGFAVIDRDEILKNSYPFVLDYLEPWRKQEIGEKTVLEVERVARVILGNLEDYWHKGVDLVMELLTEADKGKKKKLYAATMNLAVETAAKGRSPNEIWGAFHATVLVTSATPFLDRVRGLLDQFAVLKQNYKCTFLTDGIKAKDKNGLPPGITLQIGMPAAIQPGPETEFYKTASKFGVFLKLDVEASDPEAARHLADKRLGELFAAKNLFSIEDRYGIKEAAALVEDPKGNKSVVHHHRLGSHYLGSYDSRIFKVDLLLRVKDRLQKTFPSDASQLAASIEYHRLALLANSDEARLVNLWIALEALCQGGEGSIIERVWTRIAPCVAIDNVRRNLVSLSIYVKSLWTDADRDQFLAFFPHSTKDRLEPEDLAALLLLPEGHADLKKFCLLCKKHPLVLHRLYRAKSMMLDSAGSVKANVEYTRQNIEWQLKRIYRVRNAIVHTGSANILLPQLTQHLHCYLVKAINSILFDLDRQQMWSIRDSFEHRMRLFDHFVALFGKKPEPGKGIGVAAIVNPEASMTRQTEPFAWPPPAAPAVAPAAVSVAVPAATPATVATTPAAVATQAAPATPSVPQVAALPTTATALAPTSPPSPDEGSKTK